jgi:hypothetical protein
MNLNNILKKDARVRTNQEIVKIGQKPQQIRPTQRKFVGI